MAQTLDGAKRIANGTYGEVWIDGEKVAECTGCQAKVTLNKKTVNLCGELMEDVKILSAKGAGSLTLQKVDSGMAVKLGDLQSGIDRRFTVISKLRDPDSYGAERVALYGVSFDELTLADWTSATEGTVTAPFTFTKYEYLDRIEVQ